MELHGPVNVTHFQSYRGNQLHGTTMTAKLSRQAAGKLLEFLSSFPSVSAIQKLNDSISNDLPEELEATPLDGNYIIPDGIDRSKCSYFNYDEAHSGRFSLFDSGGATIDASHVIERPNALAYIRDNLSYGSVDKQDDCVVFVNGMRTAQQPGKVPGVMSSKRVQFYSDTLLGIKMAHVHTATNLDQPPGKINVKNTVALNVFTAAMKFIGVSPLAPNENGDIEVPQTMLDMLQASLSVAGAMDTPIKSTLRQLIKLANENNKLTLMVYSRGSTECNGAIREVLENSPDKEGCKRRMEKGLTVMTIGASAKSWPDGPRYIHLSSWDDAVARVFCNANRNTFAGQNAVFLHYNSPYPKTFDSHNFQAGTSQFLAVVMLKNKLKTLREIWELGQHGTSNTRMNQKGSNSAPLNAVEYGLGLAKQFIGFNPSPVGGGGVIEIPENIDELVDAMISLTNATDYLWDETSLEGMRPLPSKEFAVTILSNEIGKSKEILQIATRFGNEQSHADSIAENDNVITESDNFSTSQKGLSLPRDVKTLEHSDKISDFI